MVPTDLAWFVMMTTVFHKRVVGVDAEARFRAELRAHRHASECWASAAPGWTLPELVHAVTEDRQLSFTYVGGEMMTWADLVEITQALRAGVDSVGVGTRCWVHGDVHPGNVLRTDEGFALVDWELGREGVVEEDVGSLLAHALVRDVTTTRDLHLARAVLVELASTLPERIVCALAAADLERQIDREARVGDRRRVAVRTTAIRALEELVG